MSKINSILFAIFVGIVAFNLGLFANKSTDVVPSMCVVIDYEGLYSMMYDRIELAKRFDREFEGRAGYESLTNNGIIQSIEGDIAKVLAVQEGRADEFEKLSVLTISRVNNLQKEAVCTKL